MNASRCGGPQKVAAPALPTVSLGRDRRGAFALDARRGRG